MEGLCTLLILEQRVLGMLRMLIGEVTCITGSLKIEKSAITFRNESQDLAWASLKIQCALCT